MEKDKQRQIASKGGKAAHEKGTAHEFTSDEARRAGSKGGKASQAKRQQLKLARLGQPGQPSASVGSPTINAPQGVVAQTTQPVSAGGADIFALLQNDHRNVSQLLARMLGASAGEFSQQEELYPKVRSELEAHASAEEARVYTKLRDGSTDLAEEATREHNDIRDVLARLDSLFGSEAGAEGSREEWIAGVTELRDTVEHHVQEEESEIFDALRTRYSHEELTQMAHEFKQAKEQAQKSQEQAA